MKSKIFSKSWPASLCSWHTVTLGRLLFRIQHIWNWWMLNFHPLASTSFFRRPQYLDVNISLWCLLKMQRGCWLLFWKKWNFLPLFFQGGKELLPEKEKSPSFPLFFVSLNWRWHVRSLLPLYFFWSMWGIVSIWKRGGHHLKWHPIVHFWWRAIQGDIFAVRNEIFELFII